MCGKNETPVPTVSFEEAIAGQANPVKDLDICEWVAGDNRSRRTVRRETAFGVAVAFGLHVLAPFLIVFLGMRFPVPSVSEAPFIPVSLVSLAGAGKGSGGFPGSPGAVGTGTSGTVVKKVSVSKGRGVGVAIKKSPAALRNVIAKAAKPPDRLAKKSYKVTGPQRQKTVRLPVADREELSGKPPYGGAAVLADKAPTSSALSSAMGHGSNSSGQGGGAPTGLGSGAGAGYGTGGSGGFGLTQVDTQPVVIKKVEPRFPDVARQMGISGKVVLKFLVKANGSVDKVAVIASRPEGVFNGSAIEAVGQWRFKPGRYRGKAVDVWVELPIRFDLSR